MRLHLRWIAEAERQYASGLKQLEEAGRQFKPRIGNPKLEEEVAKFEAILATSAQAQSPAKV